MSELVLSEPKSLVEPTGVEERDIAILQRSETTPYGMGCIRHIPW
jgi:hypothetical protein